MSSEQELFDFCSSIFPICRSITGEGNRETVRHIQKIVPVTQHEIPTGTRAFDWVVPDEWRITDAFVEDEQGNRVIDFRENNLHVVGYSVPVDEIVSRETLMSHLHTDPRDPDAIPYVTSYYKRNWGFCTSKNKWESVSGEKFRVKIDSEIFPGSLTYADLVVKGETQEEILVTTYICHPSMANNECSGPTVAAFLAKWLLEGPTRRYTYRFVFAPETIGAVCYISENWDAIRNRVVGAINLTCVGDDRALSLMPSRRGNTRIDKIARHVLNTSGMAYKEYSFSERGSDERQYSHPLVDIPIVSVMRSKYGTYPEYHSSLDDLSLVTPSGLKTALEINKRVIEAIEANSVYSNVFPCEPMLSRRDLTPASWMTRRTAGDRPENHDYRAMINAIFECDGQNDLIDVANNLNISFEKCRHLLHTLAAEGILRDDHYGDNTCKSWFKAS